METVIRVTAKNVYGRNLLYPQNEQAKLLARIAGKDTLSLSHLQLAQKMGFTIEEVSTITRITEKLSA